MTFGQRLTELRTKKEITQEELAEKLNVSSQTIRRWEYDSTCPDINQLKKLCEVLESSYDFFINDLRSEENDATSLINTKPPQSIIAKVAVFITYFLYLLVTAIKTFSDGKIGLGANDEVQIYLNWVSTPTLIIFAFTIIQLVLYLKRKNSQGFVMQMVVLSILKTVCAFLPYFIIEVLNFNFNVLIIFILIILIGVLEITAVFVGEYCRLQYKSFEENNELVLKSKRNVLLNIFFYSFLMLCSIIIVLFLFYI